MNRGTLFVTGTDTGVGKTVLTACLAAQGCRRGWKVAALKPLCSGDRGDALALWKAAGGVTPLDEVNPWHFQAPLAPLLAARRERRRVSLSDVLRHVRAIRRRFDFTLVEGAGGLLSPLGEGFSSLDLIVALDARPVVVCPNRLGAVNQALLVFAALPARFRARAAAVLVDPPRPDLAGRTNLLLLRELLGLGRVHVLPWIKNRSEPSLRVARLCNALLGAKASRAPAAPKGLTPRARAARRAARR